MGSNENLAGVVLILVGLGVLLLVILLPLSFSGVEYYQYAFARRKASGRVNLDRVYSGGKYHIGVAAEFKAFLADAHFVEFEDLAVFTSDRLEVLLDCKFQYFLNPDELPLLHEKYDIQYKEIIRNNALDAVKSATVAFSTRDFGTQRSEIENALFQAVRHRLSGSCCPIWCDAPNFDCNITSCIPRENCTADDRGLFVSVRFFQLGYVKVPNDVLSRNLLTLTQLEDAEKEQYIQDAQVVQIETNQMVKQIENEAEEISQNATAQSNLVRSQASAQSRAIVENSHNTGLASMYGMLNITSQDQKASLNYLRSLRDHTSLYMSINFNSLISARGFN